MYERSGDGELKTVAYLRNDRSNRFLPMLYDTLSSREKRPRATNWEQGKFGKKQRNREIRSREREKERVVKQEGKSERAKLPFQEASKVTTIRCVNVSVRKRVMHRAMYRTLLNTNKNCISNILKFRGFFNLRSKLRTLQL